MASRDTLRIVAPELASESDARLDLFLGMAARRCDAEEYGDLYADACIYLAAHLVTLSSRAVGGGGGAGPVVAESAGDLSRSYGAVVGVLSSDATLATTPYGIEYLNIRKSIGPAALVV